MDMNPVPEKGGYSAGDRTVSELPPPPPSVSVRGSSPRIRQCAAHLAREFHDTQERKRFPGGPSRRLDWNELIDSDRALLVETFYSLVYRGVILCPVPEHRIGVSLRT